MFKFKQRVQLALDRAVYISIILLFSLFAWYGFPLVLLLVRFMSFMCEKVWFTIVPYIFTFRCINNLNETPFLTAWEHCYNLRQYFPMNLVYQCQYAGVDYQTCIDIVQQTPFTFLEYINFHNLNFDPFKMLRLFPLH